jgi:hypothetical protein
MRELILLRHAHAEPASTGQADLDRPLSPEGLAEAEAAGRWLAEHAGTADAVLDTRGWAAFVSGRPSYDYWHVRQSFTDSRLAYIVVGTDELEAKSRRGATLRAVLAFAATPCAEFPERPGDREVGVRVFRYRRPDSWEGLSP